MKVWAQLVVEVARAQWKKNTLLILGVLLDTFKGSAEVFNYLSEKLSLSQKLRYFRGSRFSQCCIPSTTLHCSLPRIAYNYFEKLPIVPGAFKKGIYPDGTVPTWHRDVRGIIHGAVSTSICKVASPMYELWKLQQALWKVCPRCN